MHAIDKAGGCPRGVGAVGLSSSMDRCWDGEAMMLWRALYNVIFVPLMELGLILAGSVNGKVRRGIKGRLGEGERLRTARSRCRDDVPRILIHCASAGELESAVPIIEAMGDAHDVDILLSYFSPSAVDRATKVEGPVDHLYLPVDSRRRIRRLLQTLEPSLIVFVKHDIWPNVVWEARSAGIPVVLANGNFRPDSKRLKRAAIPFGRAVLPYLNAIYTVARDDAHRFRFLAGKEPTIIVTGDTRFDRVIQRARQGRDDQGALADRLKGRSVAVAGSTWPADEKRLLPAWKKVKEQMPEAVLVVAPHEPGMSRLRQIIESASAEGLSAVTMTEIEEGAELADLLLVDRVGVLAGIYGLGKIAYVGGAFGTGVHSVIEPAVFGIPVLFGPRHLMSHEARDLVELGAALKVEDSEEVFEAVKDALAGGPVSVERGDKAGAFVREREGVATRVAEHLVALAQDS